jgi:hypothetical protein
MCVCMHDVLQAPQHPQTPGAPRQAHGYGEGCGGHASRTDSASACADWEEHARSPHGTGGTQQQED